MSKPQEAEVMCQRGKEARTEAQGGRRHHRRAKARKKMAMCGGPRETAGWSNSYNVKGWPSLPHQISYHRVKGHAVNFCRHKLLCSANGSNSGLKNPDFEGRNLKNPTLAAAAGEEERTRLPQLVSVLSILPSFHTSALARSFSRLSLCRSSAHLSQSQNPTIPSRWYLWHPLRA